MDLFHKVIGGRRGERAARGHGCQGCKKDRSSSSRDFLCLRGAGESDEGADVIGVRFETVYKRNYPNGSLACHLLGYTASGNVGQGGIEGYYNDYLNGVDGKTYRYMSGSGGVDSETVAAQNGETVVSTRRS